MAVWLKQSTAVTIKFGPFLDDADGKTAETGLTISQADIRLSKNGGDIAQTNNAAGATHDELGYYDVPLNTTDTNTLGVLRVAVHEGGALPVWQDFMVVPAMVWDGLFGSMAELAQAAPSATPDLASAIMFLYMSLRNQTVETSSSFTVSNDAGTVITKQTVTDNGTSLTRAEFVSGP